ncbi:hypothetical protein CHS0354_007407 [Potamilus streckersoni]|uniref:SOCS box domain-containing protein n=1 Tax=Potamilus streckersoni TaxID=2493646 RepID=A0AAE0SRI2_9BIVA|nr:hypothetical protein CHS0354_007407 [Potamilus streckersoni]
MGNKQFACACHSSLENCSREDLMNWYLGLESNEDTDAASVDEDWEAKTTLYEKLRAGEMSLEEFKTYKKYWKQDIKLKTRHGCRCAGRFEQGELSEFRSLERSTTSKTCACNHNGIGERGETASVKPIHLVAMSDTNHDLLVALISDGCDLNSLTNYHKFTPLYIAVSYGCKSLMKVLKERGAKVNKVASQTIFCTAVHKAIERGDPEILDILLSSKKIKVNKTSPRNETALHLAVLIGRKFVSTLLSAGADPNIVFNQTTCLMHAVSSQDEETTKQLLDHGANVRAKDKNGHEAILYASRTLCANLYRLLLDAGADPNAIDSSGFPLLVNCASRGNYEIVKTIVEHGADVNLTNSVQYSPLHMAAWNGHTDCVDLLIKSGATHDKQTLDGNTPLALACHGNHPKVVDLLLTLGCNVNNADKDLDTPLLYATHNGMTDTVKSLIEHGANPDQCNGAGTSPLWCAVYCGRKEVVKILLMESVHLETPSVGSDPHLRSLQVYNNPVSPLWLATAKADEEILQLLLYAGYDVHKEQWLTKREFPELCLENNGNILLDYLSSPLPLKFICRNYLRRKFERSLREVVDSFEIPRTLKDFLLLQDVLWM